MLTVPARNHDTEDSNHTCYPFGYDFARYHTYSGNCYARDTMQDLFQRRNQRINTQIPVRLDLLSDQTKEMGLSFDQLLYEHTLFPYFSLFAKKNTIASQYQRIRQGAEVHWSGYLGLLHATSKVPNLRYCPICRDEEQKQYGDCYWHRNHQIQGVFFCNRHRCLLRNSIVCNSGRVTQQYYPLSSKEVEMGADPCPFINQNTELRLWELQSDILFCLQNYERIRDVFESYEESFAAVYLFILSSKGVATEHGVLKTEHFLKAVENFWSKDLMSLLDLFWEDEKYPWVIRLCRRNERTFHPLKHILMAEFLCGGMEAFLQCAEKNREEICLERRLHSYEKEVDEDKLNMYRARWLTARKHAEKDTISAIWSKDMAATTWLRRHDKQWLTENSPLPCKRGGNITFHDWETLDRTYALKVRAIVETLRLESGKPRQISEKRIVAALGLNEQNWCSKKAKFPKTTAEIELNKESAEQWRMRRLQWAINDDKNSNEAMAPWRILKKAGIRDKDWNIYRSEVMIHLDQTKPNKQGIQYESEPVNHAI